MASMLILRRFILFTSLLVFFSMGVSYVASASAPVLPAGGAADVIDPSRVLDLEGLWLFHPGDNPVFSYPALDDANWEQ